MPSGPTPELTVNHTDQLLVVLEAGLDGPTQAAESNEVELRYLQRRIAQVDFEFAYGEGATKDQLDLGTGQGVTHRDGAQGGQVGDDRPLLPSLMVSRLHLVAGKEAATSTTDRESAASATNKIWTRDPTVFPAWKLCA